MQKYAEIHLFISGFHLYCLLLLINNKNALNEYYRNVTTAFCFSK